MRIDTGNSIDFYPRSPCGERRITDGSICLDSNISIHALLAESDLIILIVLFTPPIFLSTLSLRRATFEEQIEQEIAPISIHALRAESDEQSSSYSAYLEISIHALLAESDKINPES